MSSPASPIVDALACYRELHRFLTGKLGSRSDAEDITQSSYEQMLQALQTQRQLQVESPRALLYRIAHNLCIDHYRRQKTARNWAEQASHASPATRFAPAAEYLVAQRQIIERIVTQLMQLPTARRNVFILFRAYGMSRTEIAAHLGIKESTVAKHVVRATLDCARVFAVLHANLPEHIEPGECSAGIRE